MPSVTVENLAKSFDDNVVLDSVSFSIADGEFCVLLGPSGCGKTTLLRVLAGLERHDGGRILFGDEDVGDLSPQQRDIAMVFQSYALYPHLTVFDNLAFPLRASGSPRSEIDRRVETTAALLGIANLLGRKPRALSGGQRQRVAIGRAIVRDPRVFLFDEPLSNLDAGLRSEMRQELTKLHQELGTTIVYVTHDQVEAMTLGQKIVVLRDGMVQQVGSPEALYQRPDNLFVARFIGSPAMNCIDGTLDEDAEGLLFRSPDLTLRLESSDHTRSLVGEAVVLGLRPEAITPGMGTLVGRLSYIEDLGAEVQLHLEVGDSEIVVRAARGWRGRRLEELVEFSLDGTSIHLFHHGRRVQYEAGHRNDRPTAE